MLTRKSVASKWRPNILGESPGMGSIFTQISWPFFADSTVLWFISMLVTMPMSTNYTPHRLPWLQTTPRTGYHGYKLHTTQVPMATHHTGSHGYHPHRFPWLPNTPGL